MPRQWSYTRMESDPGPAHWRDQKRPQRDQLFDRPTDAHKVDIAYRDSTAERATAGIDDSTYRRRTRARHRILAQLVAEGIVTTPRIIC